MWHIQIFLLVFIFAMHQTLLIATDDRTTIHNTIHYLNHLQGRIQSNIEILNSRIPQISSKLYKNIQDISSRSNIPNILSSIQNQITDSSQCATNANNQISTITHSSKADVSQCVNDAISKTGNLAAQAGVLLVKANGVRNDVVKRIETCVKGNIANEVTLALCLLAQVYPIQESLGGLEQEIEATLGVGEQTAENILIGLSQCLVEIEDIAKEKSNNIIKSYHDCLHFNTLHGK